MKREFDYDIMEIIKERWSTRSFKSEKIPDDDIKAIIEAARYAPSCFNEQPWRFIVASEENELKVLQSFLNEKNFTWAKNAPVLIVILASNVFKHNQKENRYNKFDTGTAWGFLQLEAWTRGYATHGMAGFSKKQARAELMIPDDYDIVAMVAMGKIGEDIDFPNTRNPLKDVYLDINAFKKK